MLYLISLLAPLSAVPAANVETPAAASVPAATSTVGSGWTGVVLGRGALRSGTTTVPLRRLDLQLRPDNSFRLRATAQDSAALSSVFEGRWQQTKANVISLTLESWNGTSTRGSGWLSVDESGPTRLLLSPQNATENANSSAARLDFAITQVVSWKPLIATTPPPAPLSEVALTPAQTEAAAPPFSLAQFVTGRGTLMRDERDQQPILFSHLRIALNSNRTAQIELEDDARTKMQGSWRPLGAERIEIVLGGFHSSVLALELWGDKVSRLRSLAGSPRLDFEAGVAWPRVEETPLVNPPVVVAPPVVNSPIVVPFPQPIPQPVPQPFPNYDWPGPGYFPFPTHDPFLYPSYPYDRDWHYKPRPHRSPDPRPDQPDRPNRPELPQIPPPSPKPKPEPDSTPKPTPDPDPKPQKDKNDEDEKRRNRPTPRVLRPR